MKEFVCSNGFCLFLVLGVSIGTSPAEEKKEREEKKMTLFRKLSFRPTVEELKARKVKKEKMKTMLAAVRRAAPRTWGW